jgi:hypothetical protein
MLAGQVKFYNESDEVFGIDAEDIDFNTYVNSKEFYKDIFQYQADKIISSISYCDSPRGPMITVLYERDVSLYADVPADEDTIVKYETNIKLDGLNGLFQTWSFEGVIGSSLIFQNEDVENLSDDELKALTERNMIIGEKGFTVKRTDGKYTFVNFNFSIPC